MHQIRHRNLGETVETYAPRASQLQARLNDWIESAFEHLRSAHFQNQNTPMSSARNHAYEELNADSTVYIAWAHHRQQRWEENHLREPPQSIYDLRLQASALIMLMHTEDWEDVQWNETKLWFPTNHLQESPNYRYKKYQTHSNHLNSSAAVQSQLNSHKKAIPTLKNHHDHNRNPQPFSQLQILNKTYTFFERHTFYRKLVPLI